jgi:hypothetical protein
MESKTKKIILLLFLIPTIAIASFLIYFSIPTNRLLCQVWSENSPYGQRTEFKVNWINLMDEVESESDLIDCWLFDLDNVTVIAPDESIHSLYKDFNINSYSGEVTQRWVIYGAQGLALPPTGTYQFNFIKNDKIIISKSIKYIQSELDYPTNVQAERQGNNLHVSWTAPSEINSEMWYKVIVDNDVGTDYVFFSQIYDWDAETAIMIDVPLQEGGSYKLNVAIFFSEGYAYSEYFYFNWN